MIVCALSPTRFETGRAHPVIWVDIELFSSAWVVDTVVDLYFIVDLILNFFTPYEEWGIRETRYAYIARHYLRGWFAIDFISCFPVQYVQYYFDATTPGTAEAGSQLKIFKVLRLVRLSKMLRLARLKRILNKYENLTFVQEYANVLILIFVILLAAHFLACLWYVVGLENDVRHGVVELGWVQLEWDGLANDTGIFEVDVLMVPVSERYVSALYYVMNSLENGVTDMERGFAVFSYLMMIIVEGLVAGVLSAMMISISGAEREVGAASSAQLPAHAWSSLSVAVSRTVHKSTHALSPGTSVFVCP